MKVIFNRKEMDAADGVTLRDFLLSAGLNQERVIVELNDELVPSPRWEETVLNDGDRLLAVTFVGGG